MKLSNWAVRSRGIICLLRNEIYSFYCSFPWPMLLVIKRVKTVRKKAGTLASLRPFK